MTPRRSAAELRQVVIAGTGGGVGVTTVTALLFSSMGDADRPAPSLLDQSGGDLGARLPEGDEATEVDHSVALHDLGSDASGAGVALLERPEVTLIVVAPATAAGAAAVERILEKTRAQHESGGLTRVLTIFVGVFGRQRVRPQIERLREKYGRNRFLTLPRDTALAAGGRVPLSRLSADTLRAQKRMALLVLDIVARRPLG